MALILGMQSVDISVNHSYTVSMDLNRLRQARSLLDESREIQRASGKRMGGPTFLSEYVQQQMRESFRNLFPFLQASEYDTSDDASVLCERWEELCRRRHIQVRDDIRREVYFLLLCELSMNAQMLSVERQKLISATLHDTELTGSILHEEEFAAFHETPCIIRHAAVGNPSDPRAFLRTVEQTVMQILAEEEFATFRETPWIIQRAAVCNPCDPRAYLRSLKKPAE